MFSSDTARAESFAMGIASPATVYNAVTIRGVGGARPCCAIVQIHYPALARKLRIPASGNEEVAAQSMAVSGRPPNRMRQMDDQLSTKGYPRVFRLLRLSRAALFSHA
jgi:hypothetical protein